MQHSPHRSNKVGVLPWRVSVAEDGLRTMHYLIHQPLPIRGDSAALPWGVARGTVQRDEKTGDAASDDIREAAEMARLAPEAIEDPLATVRREAREELGIDEAEIRLPTLHDHGLMNYASQTPGRGRYPIHLFSFQPQPVPLDTLRARARAHSADVAWQDLTGLHAMAAEGTFKPGYLPIVAAVEAMLLRASEAS